jgi:hypothetical protein
MIARLLRLQLLQPQLELLDRARDLLRRAAKLHSPQSRDLQFELLDLQRLRHETRLGGCELRFACLSLGSLRGDDLVQRGGVGGEVCEIESHA